jgi:hypothetical protein
MLPYLSVHSGFISFFSLPNKMAQVLVLLSCIEYYSDRFSLWLSILMTQCLHTRSLPQFLQDRFCDVTLNGPDLPRHFQFVTHCRPVILILLVPLTKLNKTSNIVSTRFDPKVLRQLL